jgi:hypothetical protein
MEVSFCQTISYNIKNFEYETLSQVSGNAGIIKFKIDEKVYSPGDVVVILDETDVLFHGVIGKIEAGFAFASDMKSSLLPANTVQ